MRASLIAFFLATDAYALGLGAAEGLVTPRTFLAALALLPVLLAGIAVGSRGFIRTDPAAFRKAVLVLLMILSAVGAARALA